MRRGLYCIGKLFYKNILFKLAYFLYADYTLPVDELREELTRILQDDKRWDGKVNVLQVTNASEKTMEIRALMSAADSPTAWDLRVHVREMLIRFLQKEHPDCLPRSRVELEPDRPVS